MELKFGSYGSEEADLAFRQIASRLNEAIHIQR